MRRGAVKLAWATHFFFECPIFIGDKLTSLQGCIIFTAACYRALFYREKIPPPYRQQRSKELHRSEGTQWICGITRVVNVSKGLTTPAGLTVRDFPDGKGNLARALARGGDMIIGLHIATRAIGAGIPRRSAMLSRVWYPVPSSRA